MRLPTPATASNRSGAIPLAVPAEQILSSSALLATRASRGIKPTGSTIGACTVLNRALDTLASAAARTASPKRKASLAAQKPADLPSLFSFRIPPRVHATATAEAIARGASPLALARPWLAAHTLGSLSKSDRSNLTQYRAYCASEGVPATPITVELLIGFMLHYVLSKRNSSANLNSVMSSLHRAADAHELTWPDFKADGDGRSLTKRIEMIQRDWPAEVHGAPAITLEVGLEQAIAYLRSLPPNLWALQWIAIASLMHATLLRPGEIIPLDDFPAVAGTPLGFAYPRRGDISFTPADGTGAGGGLEYAVWLPKMDKLRADRRFCTVAALELDSTAVVNAPRAMRDYLTACHLMDAPIDAPIFFYRNPDGTPCARQSTRSLLYELRHKVLRPAGVPGWATFTLRSFRPGGTTDMRASHVPPETTQKIGRWKSKRSMDLYDRGEHYVMQHLSEHRSAMRARQ